MIKVISLKNVKHLVVCPRCGHKYPEGKWCECGYQDESIPSNLSDYLESLTVEELKKICDLNELKLSNWQKTTKADLIMWMLMDESLGSKLGYSKK